MQVKHRVLGGSLLIAGTCIGAGMLALPTVTGLAGFWPAIALFILIWALMTYTAFLILEVNLCFKEDVSIISLAHKTLGKWGEIVGWISTLFLLYLLTTAYLAGGGPIIVDFFCSLTGICLPPWVGAIPLLAIFGFFVFEGTKYVDLVNRLLMIGLVITYTIIIFMLSPYIEKVNLSHIDWKYTILPASLLTTSFGYHVIIPTLTTYLHHDKRKLITTILIGSTLPLIIYIVWEIITLGIVPVSEIFDGYQEGITGVKLLTGSVGKIGVTIVAQVFSFFAIVTSFLGVTLSLTDFLADGFKIKKNHKGRVTLFALTFTPPLIFILTYPKAFIGALNIAGAFGVVVLLIILPCLMAWSSRYRQNMKSPIRVPGGKFAIILTLMLSVVIIILELANQFGYLEKLLF